MRQIIARQEVTPKVSGLQVGTRRWLANPLLSAGRAAGPGERVPVVPLSGANEAVNGQRGRAAQRPIWRGRPDRLANPFPDHKFRDRKYLLAASETTIIHSLICQLLERDQLLPLNGRHIRSPPQPWPSRPPGSTARADSNRLYCISAGHETGDMKCPRSGSNRHWGPF